MSYLITTIELSHTEKKHPLHYMPTFEPVRNQLAESVRAPDHGKIGALEEYVGRLVALDEQQPNRSNPANRLRTADVEGHLIKEMVDATFEVWLDGEDSDEEEKHRSRLGDGQAVAKLPEIKPDLDGLPLSTQKEINKLVAGQELIPPAWTGNSDYPATRYSNRADIEKEGRFLQRSGTRVTYQALCDLLHLQMLRSDWPEAYKLFAAIVQTNDCDVRQIWGLGVEILQHLCEAEYAKASRTDQTDDVQDDEVQDDNLQFTAIARREFEHALVKGQRGFDQAEFDRVTEAIGDARYRKSLFKFLQFLVSNYRPTLAIVLAGRYPEQVYTGIKPDEYGPRDIKMLSIPSTGYLAYRSSNNRMVPSYLYTLLWQLTLSGRFKEVDTLRMQMFMRAPYVTDPMIKYILVFRKYLECVVDKREGKPVGEMVEELEKELVLLDGQLGLDLKELAKDIMSLRES